MSPVVDALVAIGESAQGAPVSRGWDESGSAWAQIFSYSRDFDTLWGLSPKKNLPTVAASAIEAPERSEEGEPSLSSVARRLIFANSLRLIVVVWDGIPAPETGPVDTTRYLTPVDWAVALAL